jgi:hypothetical protein
VDELLGHFVYFDITANLATLRDFPLRVIGVWRKWLSRRPQQAWISWEGMFRLLARHPLPQLRIRPCTVM